MKKAALALAVTAAIHTSIAQAGDVNDMMDNLFGDLKTGTPSGVYVNSLGTTVYGGSFRVRAPVTRPGPIMDIQMPSLKGGCGGFDAFAGSATFISGEQLGNFLKSVASNAANLFAYSLLMAIRSQCASCNSVLSYLENLQNTVNMFNRNSCEVARDILTGKAVDKAKEFGMKVWKAISEGGSGNGFEDKERAETTGHFLFAKQKVGEEVVKKELGGNLIYQRLKERNIAAWYGVDTSEDTLYEILQSLTGVVIAAPGSGGGNDIQITTMAPTLSLEEVFDPKSRNDEINIIHCENNDCTRVAQRKGKLPIKTFKQRFSEIFEGTGGEKGLLDILEDRNAKEADLSNRMKAAIEFLSQYTMLVSQLKSLAANPSVMRDFYSTYSDRIALNLTYTMLKSLIDDAYNAVSQSDNAANKKEALEMLSDARKRLRNDYITLFKTLESMGSTQRIDFYTTKMMIEKLD